MNEVDVSRQWEQNTPEEQVEVEQRMRTRGIERANKRNRLAKEKNLESTTKGGQLLMPQAISDLEACLALWVAEKREMVNRPGRNHSLLPVLEKVALEKVAALTVRSIIDSISQQRARTDAAGAIGGLVEDQARFDALKSSDPGLYQKALKRIEGYSGYGVKRAHIVNLMNGMSHEFKTWPRKLKIRLGVFLIEKLEESTGLIRQIPLTKKWSPGQEKQLYLIPSDSTMNYLEHANLRDALAKPVFAPCLVPPKDWTSPESGGYHTGIGRARPLVKARYAAQIQALSASRAPAVFKAVNRLQRVPWKVNTRVLEVIEDYWSRGLSVAGIPSKDPLEPPAKPADIKTNPEAKKTWRIKAREVHDENHRRVTSRLRLASLIGVAKEYKDKVLYYVYQVDWRGRAYPLSSTLHPQGCDWEKALLLFAEGAAINSPEAWNWHRIHGANCWGMDKVPFRARIEFIESRQADWVAVAEDPLTNKTWEDADEPWQFLAWCFDYAACLADETHRSHIPVHQDATQSGMQIMSLLLRDAEGGANTNCTPSDAPRDLYRAVTDRVTENLLDRRDKEGAAWAEFGLDRSATKTPVMTRVYNATLHGCRKHLSDWANDRAKSLGKEAPGKAYGLAVAVHQATDEIAPGMRACQDWLGEVARTAVHAGADLNWTTPVGYPVLQRYRRWVSRKIKVGLDVEVRSNREVRYLEETDKLDAKKTVQSFAPNYIHSLDAALMMTVVNHGSAHGISSFAVVHDSFATLAADSQQLANSIREAAISMFSEDILGELRDEVQEQLGPQVELPELPEYGDLDIQGLRDAPYFFC